MYNKFSNAIESWLEFIPESFIDQPLQEQYIQLIQQRAKVLEITPITPSNSINPTPQYSKLLVKS